MTNPFRVVVFAAVTTGVALLGAIGRLPAAYNYVGQHHASEPRRMSVPMLKASMSWRVRSVGVEQPVEPLPEEPTLSLKGNGVAALGSLAARREAMNTPAVIEPYETGIGILRPVVDGEPVDTGGLCDAGFIPEQGLGVIDCELEPGHQSDHSACGGEVTWPRTAVLEVAK